MVNIYRLIISVICFIAFDALALIPFQTEYMVSGGAGGWQSTPEAACATLYPPGDTWTAFLNSSGTHCERYDDYGSRKLPDVKINARGGGCPANSTAGESGCSCNSGFEEKNGQCIPPDPCDGLEDFCSGLKGPSAPFTYAGRVVVPDTLCYPSNAHGSCNKGCSASAAGISVTYQNSDGVLVTGTRLSFPGTTCDGPALPEAKPEPKPHDCVGDYGTVNGVTVCVPVKEATGDTQKTETVNPDGSKTESKTETTCRDGKCTTTETKTNTDAGGNPSSGGTTSTTQGQGSYCARNPASKVCNALNGKPGSPGGEGEGEDGEEGKGSFGGSCGAWTCDGDAVQCAIAKEQHQRACKLIDDNTSQEAQLYANSKGKTGNVTGDLPGNSALNFGSDHFNSTPLLGGGSCVSDLSVEVFGKVVSLPLSNVCPYVQWLRTILLAIGALLWMVIVFKG